MTTTEVKVKRCIDCPHFKTKYVYTDTVAEFDLFHYKKHFLEGRLRSGDHIKCTHCKQNTERGVRVWYCDKTKKLYIKERWALALTSPSKECF